MHLKQFKDFIEENGIKTGLLNKIILDYKDVVLKLYEKIKDNENHSTGKNCNL